MSSFEITIARLGEHLQKIEPHLPLNSSYKNIDMISEVANENAV